MGNKVLLPRGTRTRFNTLVGSESLDLGRLYFITDENRVVLGLSSNTSINLATSADLALKANLASPALTGNPTAPTQAAGNNSTRIATTAFVTAAVNTRATAAQGALADTAVQPSSLAVVATSGDYNDLSNRPTIPQGTVQSVGITAPAGLIAGPAITTSGNISLSWDSGYQAFTALEANKLSAIAAGATLNATDAQLRARSSHTGTQAISTIVNLQTSLDATEKTANKGVANGYAGLDVNGKVPLAQINESLIGGVNYKGTWNASTNTPAIPTASSANKGFYYIISVAGTTEINDVNDWQVGDWIVSSGIGWDKIDSSDQVNSVNGKTGIVVLTATDVGLGNVANLAPANLPVSTATQTALNLKANLASPALTGNPTAPTQVASDNSTRVATTAYVTSAITTFGSSLGISGVTGLQTALDNKLSSSGGTVTGQLISTTANNSYAFRYSFGTVNSGLYNHDGTAALYLRSSDNSLATVIRPDTTSSFSSSVSVTGNVTASGNLSAYSDKRLKSNIKPIENALQKILDLNGYTFDMNGKRSLGLIAQDLQKGFPELVIENEDKDKTLSVVYGNFVAVLIEAIKEQQAQIDLLSSRLDTVEF